MSEITYNENDPNGPINRAIVTEEGLLKVLSGSIESSLNMSTDATTAGGTYIGTAEMNDAPDVLVVVKTDQNGVLYCEFSPDGTNWDTSLSFNYNTERINPPHVLVKAARYFRVRFENTSGSDQTYFRLNCYYGSFNKLTAPINGTLAENYDALVVRTTDYHYEVALGKRQGSKTWNKWGYNGDLDTGTETIWTQGGLFVPLSIATTLDVVSTSVNDTDGGSGANSVVIYGIDENYEEQIEVVTLNGITPVSTVGTYFGVNRVAIYLAGSLQINDGTINIDDGTPQAQIPAGEGSTQQAIYHTQANHTALTDWLSINVNKISGGSSPRVTIKGWVFSRVSNAKYEVFRASIDTDVENYLQISPSQPFVVGEKSVLYFEATTNTNNTVVNCRFSLIEQRSS